MTVTQVEWIEEVVEVEARFTPRGMRPMAFVWQGRRRPVRQVTCVWTERDGQLVRRCFALTDGEAAYELRFEPRSLRWQLTRLALEG